MGRRRRPDAPDRAQHGHLARRFARTLDVLGVARVRLLVAVSGGRDSCVLLDLLQTLAPSLELELAVGHVHHGLRGADADADAAHVEALARAAGLPFHVARVDPLAARQGGPSRVRPSLEEAARDLRRAALASMAAASGARTIATAHHAGDQAETLLLRLLRGTGPDGLAGMAPRSEDGLWLRPLLDVDPRTLAAHARARGLVWREDASNRDRRFARNRLRHEVVPRLESEFNPRLLRALGDLAEAAREDRGWIESAVDEATKARVAWRGPALCFVLEDWSGLPETLARRVVRRALVEAGLGRSVSAGLLARVLGWLRRGRRVGRDKRMELPGGFVLRRTDDHFALTGPLPRPSDGPRGGGDQGC